MEDWFPNVFYIPYDMYTVILCFPLIAHNDANISQLAGANVYYSQTVFFSLLSLQYRYEFPH